MNPPVGSRHHPYSQGRPHHEQSGPRSAELQVCMIAITSLENKLSEFVKKGKSSLVIPV